MINPWTVTLSVNAGISLETEGLRIWVDALHDRQVPDFSTLTPEMQSELFRSERFQNPDVIAYTHCHPDHFSQTLTADALRRYPNARLILPENRFPGQLLLRGQEMIVPVKGRLLTFRRLPHGGETYGNVPHYGLMIEDGGQRILILGDCALESGVLRDWVKDLELDTVFATFPWIALKSGRRFVREVLHPNHLLVYHFPLTRDDVYHYKKAARKGAAQLGMDVRLLTEAFQTELF